MSESLFPPARSFVSMIGVDAVDNAIGWATPLIFKHRQILSGVYLLAPRYLDPLISTEAET